MALREKIARVGASLTTNPLDWTPALTSDSEGDTIYVLAHAAIGLRLESASTYICTAANKGIKLFYKDEEVELSSQESRFLIEQWQKRMDLVDTEIEKSQIRSTQHIYDRIPLL